MKRYDCETDYQAGIMVEYDDGEYVRFNDLPDLVRTTLLEKNVSETNNNGEVSNEFAEEPSADVAVAEPSAVHAAVKEALTPPPGATTIKMMPCPCAAGETNLMLDVPQGQKIGRATCSICGIWGVDFLVPRSQSQDLVAAAAAKAWNEAPRG